MIIVGDIGNTDTKICLVNFKNKIIKRTTINTNSINHKSLKKLLSSRIVKLLRLLLAR